jgi:cytochrome c peroxidase
MAQLGEKVFNDPSLSANGNQSCASCHVAASGHAGVPNATAAGLGSDATELGSDGTSLGKRVAPSIRYLAFNKAFRFEADGTPTGGFFWDGRADSLAAQGKGPFLNPAEMANTDVAAVITRLAAASYASEFKALFGQGIFNDPDAAFDRVALALQAYQKEDPDFAPFSSKYDAFLRGQTSLTSAELRGLAWFNSAAKGNCKACHPSGKSADGTFPLFTDFSFDSLGVPKNWAVPASHGDKGLCDSGLPAVDALSSAGKDALCGAFKVPSLRNVGLRKAFFHNGKFRNLTDVVTFYVQRDTNPEKWYLNGSGQPEQKFNDLPDFRDHVNTSEAPYNRHPGDEPALNANEINEVVAFLCTLSDGWAGATQTCNR